MIDLLVVNYKTPVMLDRLVITLNSDYQPGTWKLYIADNGGDEESRRLIEHYLSANDIYHVEHIWYNDNIGYSAAINAMAEQTDSEFLCAVNADTWFTTNHVKQVEASFKAKPQAGVIGVKQLDEQHKIRHGGILWIGPGSNPIHRGWSESDPFDAKFKDVTECWTVSGSIYYVRRSAWNHIANYEPYRALFPNNVGAFLPTQHYFEETFCSQMAHFLGYQVWYDGEVETAGHSWNASTGAHTQQLQDWFAESRAIYVDACNSLGVVHEC